MLHDKTAVATIAVRDMEVAKQFYEDTLGLSRADSEDPGGVLYKSGGSFVFVYKSEFAGTNKATSVSWRVGDNVESTVMELKDKGVVFETYDDMPGVTRNGEVHLIGELKAAWFKDPDGNILNIVNK
jgi:catechol 2,3-dioxygenase-like lactoylglutathione lyase family enzyme